LADVNGAGKLDLIVVNSCSSNTCSDEASTVSVLFGNGNGTFKTAVTYASGGDFAVGLAVADVNGDKKADLLVVNQSQGTVGVLLNKGNGTFKASVPYLAGGTNNAQAIAVGDVDGDGRLDLAVANYNTDSVSILLGTGSGTFHTAVAYPTGAGNPQALALGDVNGDGKLDLVVANCSVTDGGCGFGEQGSVDVLLGNGDGSFQSTKVYDSGGETASSVFLADVNGDGKIDVLVADACATNS
jgi:FG-GAP-like repeat